MIGKISNDGDGVMVFNGTVISISVIYWQSVFLVEETGVPGEIYRPVAITDKPYHIMLYQVHPATSGIRTRNFSGDGQ